LRALRQRKALPAVAAVRAAIQASVRAGVDHVRVVRVHRERLDLRLLRQSVVQLTPGPAVHLSGEQAAARARLRSRCPDEDPGCTAHRRPPARVWGVSLALRAWWGWGRTGCG